MIIYSEKTKKTYTTVEACAEAEAAYDAKVAEEKRIAEEKEAARKVRVAELDEAYEAVIKAQEHYNELVEAYNADYPDDEECCCCGCDCCDDEEECECGCDEHEIPVGAIPLDIVMGAVISALLR